jgi:hypothetical protein
LVQPIAKIYSQGFYRNLFHIFPNFILFPMHFRVLNEFLEFIIENWNLGKGKRVNSARPKSGPRPHYTSPAQWGKGCPAGPCRWHRVGVPTGCHHAPGTRGGTVGAGSRAAVRWRSRWSEHPWGKGHLLGTVMEARAHLGGGSTWGQRSGSTRQCSTARRCVRWSPVTGGAPAASWKREGGEMQLYLKYNHKRKGLT